MNGKRVMVVFPAGRTLERTISEIPQGVVDDLLLVDDASGDDTVEAAKRLGIPFVVHPENRGYGGNQKTCYAEALARGADIVIMLHPRHATLSSVFMSAETGNRTAMLIAENGPR